MSKKGKTGGSAVVVPKVECCASRPKCTRCPIRMLKSGCLPEGYSVKKRKVVRLDSNGKIAEGKVVKAELKAVTAKSVKAARKEQSAA